MQMPTSGQTAAFGRHVVTAVSTAVTMLAALHLMTPEQVASATHAFGDISDGFAKIIAGVGVLVPLGIAVFAALTASPLWQMFAVAKSATTPPEVKQAIVANVPAITLSPVPPGSIGAPSPAVIAACALAIMLTACTQAQINVAVDAGSRALCDVAQAEATANAANPSVAVQAAIQAVGVACANPAVTVATINNLRVTLKNALKKGA